MSLIEGDEKNNDRIGVAIALQPSIEKL